MLLAFATILDLITTATFLQYPLQLLTLKKDKPIYKIIMGMFFVFTMVLCFYHGYFFSIQNKRGI